MTTALRCPHCDAPISLDYPYTKKIDRGRVYARICRNCQHITNIRPHQSDDPPAPDPAFTDEEVERMKFTRWRIGEDYISSQLDELQDREYEP